MFIKILTTVINLSHVTHMTQDETSVTLHFVSGATKSFIAKGAAKGASELAAQIEAALASTAANGYIANLTSDIQ